MQKKIVIIVRQHFSHRGVMVSKVHRVETRFIEFKKGKNARNKL